MLENLRKYEVLLASQSPRRRELLAELRIPFSVASIGMVDESYPDTMQSELVPEYLAHKKAMAFRSNLSDQQLLITADTLVMLENKIYGKPKNAAEAKAMLRELSGNTHKVITGVCVMTNERQETFTSTTEVKFGDLSDKEIDYYVTNFQPLDKAGAYGIQEWIGCVAVEWINGSYYNVMGLPVNRLFKVLCKF